MKVKKLSQPELSHRWLKEQQKIHLKHQLDSRLIFLYDKVKIALIFRDVQAVEIHISHRIQNSVDGWPVCVGFAGLALPLPSTTMPECRLDNWTFVISTTLDFRLQYIDTRLVLNRYQRVPSKCNLLS